ncbi:hypothetical protein CUJ83_08285 [Methanocella sp. CWC-04]|uniref:Pyrrolo-quinoline quinone repeat domain-containing protein n=1 Tax=Methanooceanicella nereidis TaxID=2052831 RepID=A0AAP2RCF3_9EURY|nr:PQQ-binding-like beta-propeller repeat protein [Methanocella sp. CWC-04]MCD1294994.1 hypothetical protein [Methanocella sp. CWC-04]
MNSPEKILGPEWKKATHGKVSVVSMTPDSSYLAAGSEDHDVYLMDHSGRLLWATTTGDDVAFVKVSDDGRFVGSYSKDNVVSFFNKTGESVWSSRIGRKVNCMDMSSDGSLIVAGSDDGVIRAFDQRGNIIWTKECHKPVNSVCISGSGALVIAGSSNGRAYMFTRDGDLRWEFIVNSPIVYVYTSYDGEFSFVLEHMNNTIHQVSDRGNELSNNTYSQNIMDLSITEDGRYIAIGFSNAFIYFTDKNGLLIWKQSIYGPIQRIKVSPDGSLIFATTIYKEVCVLNKKGELLLTYKFDNEAYGLTASYEGDYFAVGASDTVYMFSIARYLQYIAREQVKILKLMEADAQKAGSGAPATHKGAPANMNSCRLCGAPILSGKVLCNYCEMMQRRKMGGQ